MAEPSITPISTIGIVADIRRDGECDHVATKCSVFGINEKEYNSLSSICEVRPKFFTNEAHRFMVHCRWEITNNTILCFIYLILYLGCLAKSLIIPCLANL